MDGEARAGGTLAVLVEAVGLQAGEGQLVASHAQLARGLGGELLELMTGRVRE